MTSKRAAVFAMAAFLYTGSVLALSAPSLGSASSFGVLATSGVINVGPTIVSGDVGVSAGAINGFPPGSISGSRFANDDTTRQAQKDLAAAYNDLSARPVNYSALPAESPFVLTGNANTIFIIRIAGDVPAGYVVNLNGVPSSNVFWLIDGPGPVHLHARSVLAGTIIARSDIVVDRGASIFGRLLTLNGSVSLDTSDVAFCCGPVTLSPTSMPDGTVGVPYVVQTIDGSGGVEPYEVRLFAGSLPEGLILTGNVLHGTPTTANSYEFILAATDAQGCTGIRTYTVSICPTIVLPPLPSPSCDLYDQLLTASGGTGRYTFSATPPLPPGWSLSPDGRLLGTTTGCVTFTVTATDEHSCSGSRTYTVCLLSVQPLTLPDGIVGQPYPAQSIDSAGGTCAFGPLPPGFPSPTGCTLSGLPTTAGCYTFTATVTAFGISCSRMYTVCFSCPLVTIEPPELPNGVVGTPYPATIIRCVPPCTVTVSPQPPVPGLVFGGRFLSGTPTKPGVFQVTAATALDPFQCFVRRFYTVEVSCPTITLRPLALPIALRGQLYSQTLVPNGLTGAYKFSYTGTLPPPLDLNEATGVISGFPSMLGEFTFTVTATHRSGCSVTQTYTILVVRCPVEPIPALSGRELFLLSIVLAAFALTAMRGGR
jgi:hypothetical protein